MVRKFRLRKCNNKGNTLGIVMVGIIIIAILGTLILNITAANYNMKIVNAQSKKTFYYVEKAVDEIYAGIGTEVMDSMSGAYQEVMESLVKKDPSGVYVSLTNEEANNEFKADYLDKLKVKYDTAISDYSTMLNEWNTNYVIPVDGITFSVEPVDTTDILYTESAITIQDVCVKTASDNGYNASVTMDFVINTPKVQIDFSDSSSRDFGELFKYAIIAEGNGTRQNTPSIKINQNVYGATLTYYKTLIDGNVYAGSSSNQRKDSIYLNPHVDLQVNAENLVNRGSIVLDSATASLDGKDGTGLQVWAKNLSTVGEADNLNIIGNCIIGDDLEVNGNDSTVKINGNYYGYGYQASGASNNVEADSAETNEFVNTVDTFEHESRSAIIVNGKNADVNLDGLGNLILGGRSYIDLESGASTGNSTYMTGESMTYKGNQKVYMTDTSELGSIVYANPVPYSVVEPYLNAEGTDLNYAALGLTDTAGNPKVIAKRVGGSVYFYNRESNPLNQTNFYLNSVTSFSTRQTINEQIGKLNVKNLKIGSDTKSYTSGAITQIDGGMLVVPGDYKLISGENGISQTKFLELVDDMNLRYGFISSELKDFREYALGENTVNSSVNPSDTTPFKVYLDELGLSNVSGRYEVQNLEETITDGDAAEIFADAGITQADNVSIMIMDNASTGEILRNTTNCGVIICTGDLEINGDYKGFIMCGGDLTINGTGGDDQKITACKELVALLADNDDVLKDILDGYVTGSVATGSMIDMEDVSYKDLVSIENWRKN